MTATARPTSVLPAPAKPSPPVAEPREARRERILSLDVFRGMTVAGMLLVNNPGTWSAIFPPLGHAAWHGWTPTDLIFPFFLFIVGITTHLSISARRERGATDAELVRQILTRGTLIFVLGFLLSWFPFYQWGSTVGDIADPTAWDRIRWRLEHVRILGVLQRIGLAYTIAALIVLRTTLKQQVTIVVVLLFGYWFAMTLIPVPGFAIGAHALGTPGATLQAVIDRAVLGTNHIWSGSVSYDPEGLLSTIPAAGSVIFGVFVGRWIATARPMHERIAALFAAGSIAMMLGLMWGWSFPINKNIWTSSYVLFTAGAACVVLATCIWLIDVHLIRGWTPPFIVFGMNPLVAFVGSGIMARLIYTLWTVSVDGREVPVQSAIFRTVFVPLASPRVASLLFALSFVLIWYAILYVLYRRRIFLRV